MPGQPPEDGWREEAGATLAPGPDGTGKATATAAAAVEAVAAQLQAQGRAKEGSPHLLSPILCAASALPLVGTLGELSLCKHTHTHNTHTHTRSRAHLAR